MKPSFQELINFRGNNCLGGSDSLKISELSVEFPALYIILLVPNYTVTTYST